MITVGGVALGMTAREVRAELGEPVSASGAVCVFAGPCVVEFRDGVVGMVHGRPLRVDGAQFELRCPVSALEAVLGAGEREATRSPRSIRHAWREHDLRVGESQQYPGECLSFTLGRPAAS